MSQYHYKDFFFKIYTCPGLAADPLNSISPRVRPKSSELRNTVGIKKGDWVFDSKWYFASLCWVSFTFKWGITARMWSILKPANEWGWWKKWGSVTENEKSERGTGAVSVVLSFVAKDTASQTEDEHRVTKRSKQSWAEREGKTAELAKRGSAQVNQQSHRLRGELSDNMGWGSRGRDKRGH